MLDIFSPYLVAIVIGWLLSHTVKYIIDTMKGRRVDLARQLFISGGMPSSHSATVVSLWMVVLLKDGVGSAIFGVATLVVLVVIYDAMKVRRSVGEHGKAIKAMIEEADSDVKVPHTAMGHTPPEVLVGSLLGAFIGLVVHFVTM